MNFGENFSLNINDKRYCRLKKKTEEGRDWLLKWLNFEISFIKKR